MYDSDQGENDVPNQQWKIGQRKAGLWLVSIDDISKNPRLVFYPPLCSRPIAKPVSPPLRNSLGPDLSANDATHDSRYGIGVSAALYGLYYGCSEVEGMT